MHCRVDTISEKKKTPRKKNTARRRRHVINMSRKSCIRKSKVNKLRCAHLVSINERASGKLLIFVFFWKAFLLAFLAYALSLSLFATICISFPPQPFPSVLPSASTSMPAARIAAATNEAFCRMGSDTFRELHELFIYTRLCQILAKLPRASSVRLPTHVVPVVNLSDSKKPVPSDQPCWPTSLSCVREQA